MVTLRDSKPSGGASWVASRWPRHRFEKVVVARHRRSRYRSLADLNGPPAAASRLSGARMFVERE